VGKRGAAGKETGRKQQETFLHGGIKLGDWGTRSSRQRKGKGKEEGGKKGS